MGRFNDHRGMDRGKKFGDRPSRGFGGGRSDRGFSGDRAPHKMYRAVCDSCHQSCEVPFQPSGDKPVYCSACFSKKNGDDQGRFEKRRPSRPDRSDFGDKKMFRAICDKCHEECEVPFKPSGDKPVLCDNCFGKGGHKESRPNSEHGDGCGNLKKQIEVLNNKLDNILKLLNPNAPVAKEVKKEKPAPVVKTAPAKKAPVVKKAKVAKKPAKKATTKKK